MHVRAASLHVPLCSPACACNLPPPLAVASAAETAVATAMHVDVKEVSISVQDLFFCPSVSVADRGGSMDSHQSRQCDDVNSILQILTAHWLRRVACIAAYSLAQCARVMLAGRSLRRCKSWSGAAARS